MRVCSRTDLPSACSPLGRAVLRRGVIRGPQERHVHVLLEAAGEEHMVRLRGVQQAARAAAAADERFKELQHLGEVRPASGRV